MLLTSSELYPKNLGSDVVGFGVREGCRCWATGSVEEWPGWVAGCMRCIGRLGLRDLARACLTKVLQEQTELTERELLRRPCRSVSRRVGLERTRSRASECIAVQSEKEAGREQHWREVPLRLRVRL